MKICVLGCGLRTPLLVHGLVTSGLPIDQIALYDIDRSRSQLMMEIGKQIGIGHPVEIAHFPTAEEAIDGCAFAISSIRVGDMETRAADERLAVQCGFAGQETTGPAGFAMALRTIPVALRYANLVRKLAPSAWIINFTNPAGIVTQALTLHSGAKAVGICDTPAELMHQIARALDQPLDAVHCDYFGLNHLGWVRSVLVGGEEKIDLLLADKELLGRIYPAELFSADFLAALKLIPTEYVFFYYNQAVASFNQQRAGVTRGEELDKMNRRVWTDLQTHIGTGNPTSALSAYRRYLNRRNASYMHLEGAGTSAFSGPDPDWDPFEGATGYHRIAVECITALTSKNPRPLILNVRNHGCIDGLDSDDIVEVPCMVSETGPIPKPIGKVPDSVRGLMIAVKYFERLTVEAAVEGNWEKAAYALTMNPIVGSWEPARHFLELLKSADKTHFSHFQNSGILKGKSD